MFVTTVVKTKLKLSEFAFFFFFSTVVTMAAMTRIPFARSFRGKVVIYLIIITCLAMQIPLLMLWTKPIDSPHRMSVFQTFSDTKITKETIVELLHNISRQVKVPGVDCAAIFKGSKNEIAASKHVIGNVSSPLSDLFYINLTQDCVNFQKQRGYIMSSLTDEEDQFSIAYSMIVYKDTEMVERLLRAIYRPQNLYCIHVDQKASNSSFNAISAIAKCFPNVLMASRRSSVYWGTFTVLEPELTCMEDLWKYPKWKYLISLTGQEFPLRTNHELVKILTLYRGAVDVVSSVREVLRYRFRGSKDPPHGLHIVKGSVHIVVNRYATWAFKPAHTVCEKFVDFVLHHNTSKDLLAWVKTTQVPDETFFGMLNTNPQLGIQGTYKGMPEHSAARGSFARFKNWDGTSCAGRRVREICILTTGDLPLLGNSPMMFANKFFLEEDRVVIGCLEEKIFNDTRDEYKGTKVFNITPYENADFIRNKVE
ncbi:unnamed protein product [Candidula unifasciata]|uniref:Beta-1,3-galactosyl-O-glycosyl-glycoprotein beta-1,6-N-acetylglucosaminyltransferase n=1 Tax=Candidula unifasciata TaxID=100452 RepID=A0A8S3Z2A0_9EUPU|nr:unnamed protein product [Candidula unifasciata]